VTSFLAQGDDGAADEHQSSAFVVVGAGLAGAATAWRLAAAGHEVTIVERGVPADVAGSSHGSARIFRYAYSAPFYSRLVVQARAVWTELERAHGEQLIAPTGALDFGAVRNPARLAGVLAEVGVEHELLPAKEAAQRWPGINFDSLVLWHPGAGVIDAERSVHAMIELAGAHGARLLTGWEVASVDRRGSGYRVTGRTGATLDAGHVVIAAGGWLPTLLGSLSLPATFVGAMPKLLVLQEQAFHFPYVDQAEPWTTFIHKSESIQTYSLPGGRDAGFRGQKLAEFCGGRSIGSAAAHDGIVDPTNRARVIEYVEAHLPGLVPEPYAETTCLFTNTPTEDFVLDRCDGITVVSPCSGHGAKFAPLVGVLAAEVAAAGSDEAGRAAVPRPFLVTADGSRSASVEAIR
jgi:sarcosine oxidase